MKQFNIKTLATSLSLAMTATLATQAQASDIEIYQPPSAGATSLVFMLDISGSMNIRSVAQDYLQDNGTNVTWGVLTDRDRAIYNSQFHYNREDSGRGYTRNYRYVTTNDAQNATSVKTGCVPMQGGYKCYDRMSRLQDAFYLLLNGGADLLGNQIERLSDDKVIGLSSLGAFVGNQAQDTGRMIVPARRLDANVGGKTQRQVLTEEMAKMTPSTNTPTARSFAEVVAYFMGKNTTNPPSDYKTTATQYLYVPTLNNRYKCTNAYPTRCNASPTGSQFLLFPRDVIGQGVDPEEVRIYWTSYPIALQEGTTNYTSYSGYTYLKNEKILGISGFQYSDSATKDGSNTNYQSPFESSDASCAAQGVYVLTDGEPTQDYGSEGLFASAFGENFSCPQTGDSLFCAIEASKKLLSGDHTKGIPIKTAVVGFGDSFNKIPSYNPALSEADNLVNVGVRNGDIVGSLASGDNIEQKRAAAWGIVGGGGWYSGSSTQSVVDSVNAFLQQLSVDIPSMATGSPTIPVNSLNRQSFLTDAYYASFVPLPNSSQQLWTGNMNKYVTQDGALYGQGEQALFQGNGLIDATTLGMWDRAVGQDTASGVLGNLKLRTNAQNETQRQVYTETLGVTSRTLTKVTVDSLRNGAFRNSDAKNHWLSLLGYAVSENETVDFNQLSKREELRQLGATMHSSPILLTQSGKISVVDGKLVDSDRDDYIVYGSTQGVLHIVDADTGEEKFAFVPQKMVEKQKQAFLHEASTFGGRNNLFYGIDGAWIAHTEYVPRADGTLTVGSSNPSNPDAPKGRQWIYGGLRMGGKNYYGLDLSSIAKASNNTNQVTGEPVLKFNIDPEDETVYTPTGRKVYRELAHMGQSWSKPALGYVRWNGTRRLVMFVGGGYDEGYETSDYVQTNGKGAGVYMFDAETGELLWWASNNTVTTQTGGVVRHSADGDDTDRLKYSVVSRINTVDRDSDGLIDALYFGDLAGQGFRIDLDNKNKRASGNDPAVPFSIRVVRIFDEHKTDGTSPRFYEMPSISIHEAQDGSRFAVAAFGSGDRSSPLAGAHMVNGNLTTENVNTADDMVVVSYDYDLGNINWRTLAMSSLKTRATEANALKPAVLNENDKANEVVADGANQGWKYTFISSGDRKGRYKTFGEPFAIVDLLFVNTFDRDGGGLSGECGGGVIGVSSAYQFCLPTGICNQEKHGYTRDLDVPVKSNTTPGLVEITLGNNGQGIGSSNVGSISTAKDSTTNGNTAVDCSIPANQPQVECLNVATPSTLTQLRWFEARKEGK